MATTILWPAAESRRDQQLAIAAPLTGLAGKTICIVNNSWRCMEIMATHLEDYLRQQQGVKHVMHFRLAATQTLSEPEAKYIASQSDGAIVGVGL
jgi:hypothetical protein